MKQPSKPIKVKYYLLMTGNGEWHTGINTLEEARKKAAELGGGIEIFEHVETTPLTEAGQTYEPESH